MAKWEYDGSIHKYPIKEGEVWKCGNSRVAVNDLYKGLPDFMLQADMVFVDPPWNLGNLNSFQTKADLEERRANFDDFLGLVFDAIRKIAPKVCFIEMGLQNYKKCEAFLKELYPFVSVYHSTYYNSSKNRCVMLRGAFTEPTFDYEGIDEIKIIELIMKHENFTCVGDICMGRGNVGIQAFKHNKDFVGSELNRKRLAVMINQIADLGGQWEVEQCK